MKETRGTFFGGLLRGSAVVLVSIGLTSGRLLAADITIGSGQTLHSTDAAFDAYRSTDDSGVTVYTPSVSLDGGTLVFDDAVLSKFAGTISGVGNVELQSTADMTFRGGEGLQAGSTVLVNMTQKKLTLGSGNVFGGADKVSFNLTYVYFENDGDVTFPSTMTVSAYGAAFYPSKGRTVSIEGVLDLPGGNSLASSGTLRLTGTVKGGNGEGFVYCNEWSHIDFVGTKFEDGPVRISLVVFGSVTLSNLDASSATGLQLDCLQARDTYINLDGSDAAIHSLTVSQGSGDLVHIRNLKDNPVTLTMSNPSTFTGIIEPGVTLAMPGGSTLAASRIGGDAVTATSGMVTLAKTSDSFGIRTRHVRFDVSKIRTTTGTPAAPKYGDVVAFSEFALLCDSSDLRWPAGTVARQLYAHWDSPICEADKLIDGKLSTKHCIQMTEAGFAVQFDLGASVTFNGYRWYTADDANWRDPVAWTVSVSDDGQNWTVVDTVEAEVTTDRCAVAATRPISGGTELAEVVAPNGFTLSGNEFSGFVLGSYRLSQVGVSGPLQLTLDGTILSWNARLAAFDGSLGGVGTVEIAGSGDAAKVTCACDLSNLMFTGADGAHEVAFVANQTLNDKLVKARYARFNATHVRNNVFIEWYKIVAMSEFELLRDGQKVPWPAGFSVTQPIRYNEPTTCPPALAFDGNVSTYVCIEMYGYGFQLVMDFGEELAFDGYRWWTISSNSERDPESWTFEISQDGTNWQVIDTVVQGRVSEERSAIGYQKQLTTGSPTDAIADDLFLGVYGTFTLNGAKETVGGLTGDGSLVFADGAELTLNVADGASPVFAGSVSCDGVLIKDGPGRQVISGDISCRKIIVRNGILDVRKATVQSGVEVVVEGGEYRKRMGLAVVVR